MSFSGKTLFIFLWALTPLVIILASKYTQYPNQIYVLYHLFMIILAALVFRKFINIMIVQVRWLSLALLYACTFIFVSYFGADFATSVEYGVLYLPVIILLEFFVAFTIGYMYQEQRSFKYLMGVAVLLIVYTVVDILLYPEQSRYISSLNIPMAIPIFVFMGQTFLAMVAVLILFLSLKKTIVVVGLISFCLSIVFKGYMRGHTWMRNEINKALNDRTVFVRKYAKRFVLIAAIVVILIGFSPYLSKMIERFLYVNEDPTRSSISDYSFELLPEYFPQGIGLGGFSFVSKDIIPYEVIDARGVARSGANLHNSYMTWVLEGGAPIILIVSIMFWCLFRIIRRFLRIPHTRVLGATLLIWLLSGMIYGAFQQWHNSGTFWGLFGFSFGCYERYRSRK